MRRGRCSGPMRQTVTKILLVVAHGAGDRFNLVFRGFHAGNGGALLIVLFAYIARPRRLERRRRPCVSRCSC